MWGEDVLLDSISDPLVLLRGRNCLYANQAILSLLGIKKFENLEGEGFWRYIHPKDRDTLFRSLEEGYPGDVEASFRLVRGDEAVEVRAHASPIQVGEEVLWILSFHGPEVWRKTPLPLLNFVERVSDGVILLDVDLRVIYWNHGAQKISGYTPQEVLGKPISSVWPFDNEEEFQLWEGLQGQGIIRLNDVELSLKRKDGKVVPLSVTMESLIEEGGASVGYGLIIRDLTERKKLETRSGQELKEAALGRMVGAVAHNFNNLLTSIIGNLQLARMDPIVRLRPTINEVLENVLSEAWRMTKMVRDLQRLVTPGPLERRMVPVKRLVETALKKVLRKAERDQFKGVRFHLVQGLEDEVWIHGHRGDLLRALGYLLENAMESIEGEGDVNITTKGPIQDEHGLWVEIEITDTGKGMEAEALQHALEPLYSTKGRVGVGMGLPLAQAILREHGGNLKLSSAPGRGTVVTLRIPILLPTEGPQDREEEGEIKESIQETTKKILVVEDEAMVRDLIYQVLNRKGYHAICVSTGKEALGRFKKEEQVDLVLVDLGLPDMDGWEVARRVKEIKGEVPVIVITGWGLEPGWKGRYSRWVDGVLFKPFNIAQLLGGVRAALRED